MSKDSLKKQITILLKKLQKEEDLDIDTCNGYIDDLNEIKEELSDSGYEWVDKLKDIESLGGWLMEVSARDIEKTLDEIKKQLEKIFIKLGGDPEELESKREIISQINNPAPISINLNQMQQQYQNQYQFQETNVEILKKELEEELNKRRPDEDRVKNILKNIIDVAKDSASGIISGVILKILGG
jgi:hypothetical protein